MYPYVSFELLHVSFSDPGGRGMRGKGRSFFFLLFFSLFLFFFLLSPGLGSGTCGTFNLS